MSDNFFKTDDVEVNSWWDFDYCFCGSDCANKECGRNKKSKSYQKMIDTVRYHSLSPFSSHCSEYVKPKGE